MGKKLLILTVLLIPLWGVGCLNPFSPAQDSSREEGEPLLKPVSPDNVLQNFRYAYQNRDLKAYERCLDENFQFEWFDDEKGSWDSYGKAEDLKRTEGLFKYFNKSIRLTWLGEPESSIEPSKGDNPFSETRIVYLVGFELVVLWQEYPAMGDWAHGQAEFKFRKDEDTDLWYIVHWKDESEF